MSLAAEKLREVDLFADVPMEALEALVAKMQPQHYPQGTLIFRTGELGSTMYFIRKGRIHIFIEGDDGKRITIAYYGENQVFGELSPIDQRSRSAHAEAAEDLDVLALPHTAFMEVLYAYPQIGISMMKSLAWRVRNTTEVLQREKQINAPAAKETPPPVVKQQETIGEEYGVFAKMAASLKDLEAKDENQQS